MYITKTYISGKCQGIRQKAEGDRLKEEYECDI